MSDLPWEAVSLGGGAIVTTAVQLLKRVHIITTDVQIKWATVIIGAVVMLFAAYAGNPDTSFVQAVIGVITAVLSSHGFYQLFLADTGKPTPTSASSSNTSSTN